jgi:hypothetical protein
MNAEVIYKVFETAKVRNSDTTQAAEVLYGCDVIPDNDRKRQVNDFIGLHFDALCRAYGTGDKKLFDDVVKACVESRDEEVDLLIRAHATGNEKFIAEMEAKYGGVGNV